MFFPPSGGGIQDNTEGGKHVNGNTSATCLRTYEQVSWMQGQKSRKGSSRRAFPESTVFIIPVLDQVNLEAARAGSVRHSRMYGVVLPATALLHAQVPPFVLGQEARLRQDLGGLLGKDDVPGAMTKQGREPPPS